MTTAVGGVRVLTAAADGPAVPVQRLGADFFRLSSGVAGAVVQKFVTHRLRLGWAAPFGWEAGRVDARPELERRFLLARLPGEVVRRAHLVDHYLVGTRLRLRHRRAEDGSVTRTLTQKIPAPDGRPGTVTTTALDEDEYRVLARLEARVLRKVRLSVPPFGVDLYAGPLSALLIGEIEFATPDERDAYAPPGDVVLREITGDPRLRCSALAGTDPRRIADALAAAREAG